MDKAVPLRPMCMFKNKGYIRLPLLNGETKKIDSESLF